MFRCPRCQNELPSDARFCNYCGFNQTNARMESLRAGTPTARVTPSVSKNVSPHQGEGIPTNLQIIRENSRQMQERSGNGRVQGSDGSPTPLASTTGQSVEQGKAGGMSSIPETPQPVTSGSRGNSLTGRYVAEQDTRYEAALPGVVPETPNGLARPASRAENRQISTSNQLFEWGLGLPDTLAISDSPVSNGVADRSMAATNKAAEQWYKSWKDRQRAEAGPAVNVSRGQASVPEPLLVMQHSIARMRAVVLPKKQDKENNFGFWIIMIMMFCLFVGLISYIVSTYLPGVQLASQAVTTVNGPEPTLSLQAKAAKSTSFAPGQVIQVQGTNFGSHDQLIFLLDTTTLNGTDGKPATATTDSQGSFKVDLTIPSSQLAGEYALQAQDNQTGQHAFLDLTVAPSSTTNTTSLTLSMGGSPVSGLSFASIAGKKDPPGKRIELTNTGNTALQWTVSTATADNGGWLIINGNQTGGQLNGQGAVSISIGVLTQGLKVSDKAHPYKGEVIFTVANQGQVVLPVELQVADAGVEVVVMPNPVVAYISTTAPGTCQDTGLTLVNLNNTTINWTVKPSDDFNAQHIHVDGKTQESDTLQAAGYTGDSRIIKLTCTGVQVGDSYTLTVYYNGQTESVPVTISRSY